MAILALFLAAATAATRRGAIFPIVLRVVQKNRRCSERGERCGKKGSRAASIPSLSSDFSPERRSFSRTPPSRETNDSAAADSGHITMKKVSQGGRARKRGIYEVVRRRLLHQQVNLCKSSAGRNVIFVGRKAIAAMLGWGPSDPASRVITWFRNCPQRKVVEFTCSLRVETGEATLVFNPLPSAYGFRRLSRHVCSASQRQKLQMRRVREERRNMLEGRRRGI